MDYSVMENGTEVWYKLISDSELPVKVGIKYQGHSTVICKLK